MTFNEARLFARNLKLKTIDDWKKFSSSKNKPQYIPENPDSYYKNNGWIDYNDWLNIKNDKKSNIIVRDYLPFYKARQFVRTLNLKSIHNWTKYLEGSLIGYKSKPSSIPANPEKVYKNEGWIDFNDWLDISNKINNTKANDYLEFKEAREFARSLQLRSPQEWRDYVDGFLDLPPIPDNIPKNPKKIYSKNGWWGMYDWLGIKQ